MASSSSAISIYDLAEGKRVALLKASADVQSLRLSPDGTHLVSASRDQTAHVWPVLRTTQSLVDHAKQTIPRCLVREERERAFLDPVPPAWCIEMAKWPYHTQDWKDWLKFKRANLDPPLPDSRRWESWVRDHRAK
jgi:hypothetical protein